jgi:hypothetical protein
MLPKRKVLVLDDIDWKQLYSSNYRISMMNYFLICGYTRGYNSLISGHQRSSETNPQSSNSLSHRLSASDILLRLLPHAPCRSLSVPTELSLISSPPFLPSSSIVTLLFLILPLLLAFLITRFSYDHLYVRLFRHLSSSSSQSPCLGF